MVRFSSSNSPSLTQMAARKQLRKHLRRIREREYSKLRALVPAVATKKKVTKVQVIEEAVRYIEELHTALIERFRQKHGCGAESMAQETVRTFVTQMMPPLRPTSSSSSSSSSSSFPAHVTPNTHTSPLSHPYPQQQHQGGTHAAGPGIAGMGVGALPHPLRTSNNNSNSSISLPPPSSLLLTSAGGHHHLLAGPRCPVPAFLSAVGPGSFEKQRKRASFMLRRRRRDC